MAEIWKPIPLTDGYYEASNLGRIRRAKAGRRTHIGRLLKLVGCRGKYGTYQGFTCSIHGVRRNYGVAECVLDAFVGPRPTGHEADHRNHDILNNQLNNLRWRPASDNHADQWKTRWWGPQEASL